jgi:hypothetical protein
MPMLIYLPLIIWVGMLNALQEQARPVEVRAHARRRRVY